MKKYNVIVAGGGFAGVSAALAAARQGMSVLLIEKAGCLGGAASNCLVMPFMPYFTHADGKKIYLSRGIFAEIVHELQKKNAKATEQMFSDEDLKLILNRLLLKDHVDLLFHSYIYDVRKEGERISAVSVVNKSGKQSYEADFFIDATGDADLAVFSGCPVTLGRAGDQLCQPMTLCFRMVNVNLDAYYRSRGEIQALYRKFQQEGKLQNPREDILTFSFPTADGVLHFNSTRVVKKNPVDAIDLTKAEIEAREQIEELVSFLRTNFDAFKNSSVISSAPDIGIRESRMIDGVYTLTGSDLVNCVKFEDVIAVGNYDIDIHNPEGSGTSHHFFKPGTYYTIPYRSLIPQNVDNLLVAGRCISVDHEAQASVRIMPICSNLGEAAGIAAAVALKQSATNKSVDIHEVQNQLKLCGAFLG